MKTMRDYINLIENLQKQGVEEGLAKDIKRLATGKDVKSRAGQEITKAQQASMTGDNKTAHKHFKRYDKLDKLANKDQGVAEAAKWRADDLEGKTWRSPDWDDGDLSPSKIKIDRSGKDIDDSGDELTSRPGAWRGKADMAKRMTKKGVPTKSELAFQDNLKMRMRMKKKEGGLTGPKGVLPEQGVAEGLDGSNIQDIVIDTVERLFHKNNLSDYDSLEAVRQGVRHHFSKSGATTDSAINGILNILQKRMRKSDDYLDLSRFKEALRQGIAHQLKKQGVVDEQLEETSPKAIAKINQLTNK